MKVVFVGGPFRGATAWDVEQNVRRAEAAALEIWRLGAAVLCPHTNTRFFDSVLPDEVFLRGYRTMLARCDALALIPGWERSMGARDENTVAGELKIRVFQWPAERLAFKRWLDGEAAPP